MRNFLLVAILIFSCYNAQAQKKEIVDLLPGVTTLEALEGEIYIYPEFIDGIVAFKNGRSGKSKLNYCFLTNEMVFINPMGDTLAISNENEIKLVSIANDTFYFNGTNYLKQAKNYGWIKTAHLKSIKEIGRKKVGGYGETVNGVAVSLSSFNASKLFVELTNSERITILKEISYYVGNELNEFVPLSKSSLLKLIPSNRQNAAKKYLKEHDIDFDVLDQVEQLLSSIETLQKS